MATVVQEVNLASSPEAFGTTPYVSVRKAKDRVRRGMPAPELVISPEKPFGELQVFKSFDLDAVAVGDEGGLVIHFVLPRTFAYRMLGATLNFQAQTNDTVDEQYWQPSSVFSAQYHRRNIPEGYQEYGDFSSPITESGLSAPGTHMGTWLPKRQWTTPYYRGVRHYVAKPLNGIIQAPSGQQATFYFFASKPDVGAGGATRVSTATFWANFTQYEPTQASDAALLAPTPIVNA